MSPVVEANDATIATLRERWRSGKHVGSQKPVCRAYIREGRMNRLYRSVPPDEIYADVPGHHGKIWQGKWEAKTDFTPLPNVKDVEIGQNFDENGVAQATIKLDNIGMIETTGVAGLYHRMERGYYAPFRGYKPPHRPKVGDQNDWFDLLHDSSSQVIVLMGYGNTSIPVFIGLINDVDLTSRPDEITLTCRDMAQFLTDQHVFINAKPRDIPDPITFVDRRDGEDISEQAKGCRASSSSPAHPPRLGIGGTDNDYWMSGPNQRADALEWIEFSVPAGRFNSIIIKPQFAGMEAYVAVYARDKGAPGGHGATRGYNDQLHEGWIDEGNGNVPGTQVPWTNHIPRVKAKQSEINFPVGYGLGDNSHVRVYLTNLDYGLHQSRDRKRDYRAGIVQLFAYRSRTKKEAKRNKWILVDDVSDIVRTVFQWAGINEWEVETTGIRLQKHTRTVFNRGDFLIDIINRVKENVGYVFYMKPPDSFDEDDLGRDSNLSTGVGVFRSNQAMRRRSTDPVELIHEEQILKGINAKFSDESLAYNIRVRGKAISKKKGGRTLGADKQHRYMYVYNPPWSRNYDRVTALGGRNASTGGDELRTANLKKYVVWHDDRLDSLEQCKIAALFIAFREALEAAQVTIDAPAMPSIFLDHMAALFDTGTGLSTRMWVAQRTLHWTGGQSGTMVMTLGGALIDFPDIVAVREELNHALKDKNYNPGLSHWDIRHHGKIYRNVK